MIPDIGLGGVLPPFTGGDVVGEFAPRSPYLATISELTSKFATSPPRAEIVRGLLDFRDALREIGFQEGFQWIDGSFVEACEQVRKRPPDDVDVVSVVRRPEAARESSAWDAFIERYGGNLLDQECCKATYLCDAYFIDLDIPSRLVAEQTAYWSGLFSHQRDTFQWKGLVQLDLQCDDEKALQVLAEIEAQW